MWSVVRIYWIVRHDGKSNTKGVYVEANVELVNFM